MPVAIAARLLRQCTTAQSLGTATVKLVHCVRQLLQHGTNSGTVSDTLTLLAVTVV
jgi:hypothetical protein